MNDTTTQNALVEIIKALHDVIVAAGPRGVPSGHLYARLMPMGCSLARYEQIEKMLLDSKLVTKSGHVLLATKR